MPAILLEFNLDKSNPHWIVPRWIALQIILQVVDRGRTLDEILSSDWYLGSAADKRDLAFARELAYGVSRWYSSLQSMLKPRLKKPLRNKDSDVEIILLLGLYQLLYIKTDVHAAVNETVKLAAMQKKPWARGLVNAILRQIVRDEVEISVENHALSYPQWIVEKLRKDWGQQADSVLEAGNQRAPMTLRINLAKTTLSDYLATLLTAENEAVANELVATSIELKNPCDVYALPGFEAGLVSVQDASAQLAAPLLQCEKGMKVLDACAAPGGKSVHLLELYPELKLDALDQSPLRMERVSQNLKRAGKEARLIVGDAGNSTDWFDGAQYDRILADLPCSASGVIRRHPDIKLLRRPADIKRLVELQRSLLASLWALLKPGGKLLYSTCSIFKDENENQLLAFVESNQDCEELKLERADWGERRPMGYQILPGKSNMDGFYYALLHKAVG